MKHNIRIAKELVRIANELLSKNEDQAIADAVKRINQAIMMEEGRTASAGNGRIKSMILGTLTMLAFVFGIDSATKAIQLSMIEQEEKEAIEQQVVWTMKDTVRGSKWFKDKSDEGIVHNDGVLFSRTKMIPNGSVFYHMVGRQNGKGSIDLFIYDGNTSNGFVNYPEISKKTIKIDGVINNYNVVGDIYEPDERIFNIADDMILDRLLN